MRPPRAPKASSHTKGNDVLIMMLITHRNDSSPFFTHTSAGTRMPGPLTQVALPSCEFFLSFSLSRLCFFRRGACCSAHFRWTKMTKKRMMSTATASHRTVTRHICVAHHTSSAAHTTQICRVRHTQHVETSKLGVVSDRGENKGRHIMMSTITTSHQ